MTWRVRPVQRAPVGTPLQAIGSECTFGMAANFGCSLAGINTIQARSIVGFGFVDRSDPETTQSITRPSLARTLLGSYGNCAIRANAPPLSRTEDSVAQGEDQAPQALVQCSLAHWADPMSVSSPCRCWRVQPASAQYLPNTAFVHVGMPEGDSPNAHRCVETGRQSMGVIGALGSFA